MKFSATVTCQYDTIFSPFPACAFEEALGWLERGGFDAAEICIGDYEGIDLLRLQELLKRHRLGLSTISTGQACAREGISLTHPDPVRQNVACRRICAHIDAAKLLGGKVTVGSLRGMGDAADREKSLTLLAKNLGVCAEYARENGVTLLLEAINRYETLLVNSAQDAMDFLARMGNSLGVEILWDVFHANIEDPTLGAAIKTLGGALGHVHLADSNRWFPGYGHIAFETLYDGLREAGYAGHLSFECLNLPNAQTVREQAPVFIRELRARGV